jgi:HEAT repeat protein
MVEDSLASIEYLRTILDTKDARERHTIKDILRDIGEPAVPMLCDAVREGGEGAQLEAAWILGLIGSNRGFDALLDLSHAGSWKLRSGALNAIGKLSNLSADEKGRLTDRITAVLDAPDEVFYVKKDAAFAAGNQDLCGLITLLLQSLAGEHYSVRFAACEAIHRLSEVPCEDMVDAFLAGLPDSSPRTLVATLYAAHNLPVDGRLDIAKAALDLPQREYSQVALAIARLADTIEPETEDQGKRLERITARIPREFWAVDEVLGMED